MRGCTGRGAGTWAQNCDMSGVSAVSSSSSFNLRVTLVKMLLLCTCSAPCRPVSAERAESISTGSLHSSSGLSYSSSSPTLSTYLVRHRIVPIMSWNGMECFLEIDSMRYGHDAVLGGLTSCPLVNPILLQGCREDPANERQPDARCTVPGHALGAPTSPSSVSTRLIECRWAIRRNGRSPCRQLGRHTCDDDAFSVCVRY